MLHSPLFFHSFLWVKSPRDLKLHWLTEPFTNSSSLVQCDKKVFLCACYVCDCELERERERDALVVIEQKEFTNYSHEFQIFLFFLFSNIFCCSEINLFIALDCSSSALVAYLILEPISTWPVKKKSSLCYWGVGVGIPELCSRGGGGEMAKHNLEQQH